MRWLLCLLCAATLAAAEPHHDFVVPDTIRVVIEYTHVDQKGHVVGHSCDIALVKTADWVRRHGPLDDVDIASLEQLGFIRRDLELYVDPV